MTILSHKAAEVAWGQGKKVQREFDGCWIDCSPDCHCFDPNCKYRLAPEPVEFWTNEYEGEEGRYCLGVFAGSMEAVEERLPNHNYVRTVKMREVTDD